jgi:hypothetical protein
LHTVATQETSMCAEAGSANSVADHSRQLQLVSPDVHRKVQVQCGRSNAYSCAKAVLAKTAAVTSQASSSWPHQMYTASTMLSRTASTQQHTTRTYSQQQSIHGTG